MVVWVLAWLTVGLLWSPFTPQGTVLDGSEVLDSLARQVIHGEVEPLLREAGCLLPGARGW